MAANVYGEELCEHTEMVVSACSHCNGRHGDEDLEILGAW